MLPVTLHALDKIFRAVVGPLKGFSLGFIIGLDELWFPQFLEISVPEYTVMLNYVMTFDLVSVVSSSSVVSRASFRAKWAGPRD